MGTHTHVDVTTWEQAEFRLLPQPVVTLDGTVYRWQAVRRPGRCPCTWAVLCASERAQERPPLCETWVEAELTGEWSEVPEQRY
ncbi:MAG: hypothetical protein ABIH03_12945 [Pseudomonadota bacterium]